MKPAEKYWDGIKAILIAVLVALTLRQFVIAAYKIPTGSMEDTLLIGDFLLVNKFAYGAQTPDWIGIPFTRGHRILGLPTGFDVPEWLHIRFPALTKPEPYDIVVFKYPRDSRLEYIKRCVAVGGQTIEVVNKEVFVDGKPFPKPPKMKHIDPYIIARDDPFGRGFQVFEPGLGSRDNFGPYTVPEGHYFMMGDNRDNSSDSREWGPVPPQNIVGKPLIIYLSLNSMYNIRWNRLGMVIR